MVKVEFRKNSNCDIIYSECLYEMDNYQANWNWIILLFIKRLNSIFLRFVLLKESALTKNG